MLPKVWLHISGQSEGDAGSESGWAGGERRGWRFVCWIMAGKRKRREREAIGGGAQPHCKMGVG